MVERHRLLLLIAILMAVAMCATGIALAVLYDTSLEQTRSRLVEAVRSQARLLEAVALFNQEWGLGDMAYTATLVEIEDAYSRFRGFGQSGEFSVARRAGDSIEFILRHRYSQLAHPVPVPFDMDLVEPMRRALSGESGCITALDYRGELVLAAFEPVEVLDLGIVAKIYVSEIRAPFIKAGAVAAVAAVVLVVLGAFLFRRITDPLIRHLENRVAERTDDLARANRDLQSEIGERRQAEARLLEYQSQLRSLASELLLTEERERRRIATDLHDHIGQTLAVTQMRIDALRPPDDSGAQTEELDRISALLDEMDEAIRTLTFELSPPVLHELGLGPGLEWLAEQLHAQHGLHIEVSDDGQPKPLDDDIRTLIFRAVRELLMNVVKHADAGTVHVSLSREGNDIHAAVADDGAGFEPRPDSSPRDASGGFGLFSVRERMGSIGGDLRIDSTPGRGTRALLVAPLSPGGGNTEEMQS